MLPDHIPDPVAFCESLVNPETSRPFLLTPAESLFLDHAFTRTPDGRLAHPELLWSAPKKSGKTAFVAMMLLYMVRAVGGRYAEGFCCANDFEQSQGRVFQAAARIVSATPMFAADATVTANRIEFASTIIALAGDYAGAAGANPTITVFDELWGYTSERAHRLFDEMVPPPTRRIACRLTVTCAGFEGESELLQGIHNRGLAGEQIAPDLYAAGPLLMFWTNDFTAPWQTETWREEMRATLRPNQYLRLIENRWVTSESPFIDMAWWDECVDPTATPRLVDRDLEVWVGIDASVKRDSTAIVACAWDEEAQKGRLIFHRVFQPSPDDPLDFEATVEATVREIAARFRPIEIRYDPFQMVSTAQRLLADNLPMVEFPQTVGNLTEASSNLYELVKGRNLVGYRDAEIRLAVQRSIAVETSRGWRIAKEKASHKIDVVVALAQACLGATLSVTGAPVLFARTALDAEAASPPVNCSLVYASVACDERTVAVCYFAAQRDGPLFLTDFEQRVFGPDLFMHIRDKLREAGANSHCEAAMFASAALCAQARMAFEAEVMRHLERGDIAAAMAAEVRVDPIDDVIADRDACLLSVAAQIGAGRVKLATARSGYTPLFDLRPNAPATAAVDSALIGVAAGTVDLRGLPKAAPQPARRSTEAAAR